MELVDTGDLKSPDRKIVPVQVRPRAPINPLDIAEPQADINISQENFTLSVVPQNLNSRRIVDSSKTREINHLVSTYAVLSQEKQKKVISFICAKILNWPPVSCDSIKLNALSDKALAEVISHDK